MCGDPDDFDGTELDRRWQRARKPHRCMACRETIRPGDRYHLVVQIYEGSMESHQHCARCWLMCEALWDAGVGAVQWDLDCGELWDNPPDDIAALAFLSADDAQDEVKP